VFASVSASPADVARPLPGDSLVPDADVVMDRAFDLPAPPERVWPWLLQLGKRRAGWDLPGWVERFVPASKRGLRRLDPALVDAVHVGHVIPDWGGEHATFEVAILEPPHTLVHTTQRGHTAGSWAIVLTTYDGSPGRTHVQLRLRLSPVTRTWLAHTLGGAIDAATVAGQASGLRERLAES